jgi:NAD(P)-dependent dehydrogenase (short-subunit alcohol dehydrogenase family)
VVVAGRRLERLQQVADEITERGDRCAPVAMDVSRTDGLSDALDRAEGAFGTITILVNNAAIPDAQRAHRMSLELIDAVIDTNLRGPFVRTCEVARRLIAAGLPGRIINLSSMGAYHYQGDGAALYSVTKAAINRMTEALAVEWVRYGINVNAIAPGAFMTEMMEGRIARFGDFTDDLPRKRIGDPAHLTAPCSTSPHPHRSSSPAPSSKSTTGNSPAEPIPSRSDLSRGTRTVPQSVLSALGGWERAESYWAS